MKYIIDTHVHIYPFYAIETALQCTLDNFHAISPEAIKVACLTERYDCDVYTDLLLKPSAKVTSEFDINSIKHDSALQITSKQSGRQLFLLPGQQIITAENLEILSLNCAHRVEEKQSASDTITQVIDRDGIAVVAWGLGKWLGSRGKVIEQLIDKFEPHQFVIGDTTMRPYGWGTPRIMKLAQQKGFKVLCGSDPLPFQGEEIRPGSYASIIDVEGDSIDPDIALNTLFNTKSSPENVGRRGSLIEVALRTLNHKRSGKIAQKNSIAPTSV